MKVFTRIIAIISALMMLFPLLISASAKTPIDGSSVFYSVSTDILGVNTQRLADCIVIYSIPSSETRTNEWGYEVICKGGYISSMGGNNNTVPSEDGSLIVSAHGDKVTWLQNNAKIGMKVTYDNEQKTVTFTYDDQAALMGMRITVDSLWDKYNDAIAKYDNFDYVAAKEAIQNLELDINKAKADYESNKDASALVKTADNFGTKASKVAVLISESPTVEYRGVWIRPSQTNALQVDEYVQKLYSNGINTICVETLLDSTMIMPMPEDSLFEHDPYLNGFDMLQAYIDSCHKRDMELHIWLPVFYVGDAGSSNIALSVGTKKPEWRSKSSNGRIDENGGYVMLDPANQEVQDFLIESYRYILETYDIDGFQLDYIRYFESTDTYDMGYNEGAMTEFFTKYAQRPRYDRTWKLWDEWVQFRCDKITGFVRRVRDLIDEVNPDVLLGADVVPDPTASKAKNYQDYFKWLEEGLLDIVFPMAYGYGHEEAIKMQVESCGNKALIAVGLGIFMPEMTPEIMDEQANFNTAAAADGSVYFSALQFLNKNTGKILLDGVYRNRAITPTLDIKKATIAKIDYAKSRINDIILPLDGVSKDDASKIITALDELAKSIENGYEKDGTKYAFNPLMLYNLRKAVSDAELDTFAEVRITGDIDSIIKAYSVQSKNGDEVIIKEISADEIDDYVEVPEEEEKEESSNGWLVPLIIILSTIIVAAAGIFAAFMFVKNKK